MSRVSLRKPGPNNQVNKDVEYVWIPEKSNSTSENLTGLTLVKSGRLALTLAMNGIGIADARALREMQVCKVPELGLEIWLENQPAWKTELSNKSGHPIFVTQSPDFYHPSVVMTHVSRPKERVEQEFMHDTAVAVIRRASENFFA